MTPLETLVDLLERPTPGEKKTFTFIKDDIVLPATLITGIRPGKTILLTAGVHGCEYCSIQAAVELAEDRPWPNKMMRGLFSITRCVISPSCTLAWVWGRIQI